MNHHRPDYPDKDRGFRPIKFRHQHEEPKEFDLYIRADQILYDVDAQTSLIMRSRRTENQEDIHTIGTDNADDYRPMLHRWIEKYANLVCARLSAYIRTQPKRSQVNDLKFWEEMQIRLFMPEYWNANVFPLLITAVHDYIVNAVLYEYLSLELTANDPVTISKRQLMDENYDKIKEYTVAAIPGQLRKPLQPF